MYSFLLFLFESFGLYPRFILRKIKSSDFLMLLLAQEDMKPEHFYEELVNSGIKLKGSYFSCFNDDTLLGLINANYKIEHLSFLLSITENEEIINRYIDKEETLSTVEQIKLDYFASVHWVITKRYSEKLSLRIINRESYFDDLPLYDHEVKTLMYFVNVRILDETNSTEAVNWYLNLWDVIGAKLSKKVSFFNWFRMLLKINKMEGKANILENSVFLNSFILFLKAKNRSIQEAFWTNMIASEDREMTELLRIELNDFLVKCDYKVGYELFVAINNSLHSLNLLREYFKQINHLPYISINKYLLPYSSKELFDFIKEDNIESFIIKNSFFNKPLKKYLLDNKDSVTFFFSLFLIRTLELLGLTSDEVLSLIKKFQVKETMLGKYIMFPNKLINLISNKSSTSKYNIITELLNSDETITGIEDKLSFIEYYGVDLENEIKKKNDFQKLKQSIDSIFQKITLQRYETNVFDNTELRNFLKVHKVEPLFIPSNKADLIKLGLSMKNCLGAYYEKILLKQSHIAVIEVESEKIIVEFNKGFDIKELRLSANRAVDSEMVIKIKKLFK